MSERLSGRVPTLVLAAGKSTRIAEVAGDLPKPLLEIEGLSILERNLAWLTEYGIDAVWVNLHYEADRIRDVLARRRVPMPEVAFSPEPEILGTAGAYRNLEQHFRTTGLIVYGDNLLRFDLATMVERHRQTGAMATIALFDRTRHCHTGIAGGRVVLNEDGWVTGFREGQGGDAVSELVNAGVYCLEPEVADRIPAGAFADFGRDVFPELLRRGEPVMGYLIDDAGYCMGLDTPESYRTAVDMIERKQVVLK